MAAEEKPKLFSPLTIPEYELQTAWLERRDALLTRRLNITRAIVRAFDFAISYNPTSPPLLSSSHINREEPSTLD